MNDAKQGSFGSHRFDRWIVQLREDLRQRGVSSAKLYFDDHFNGAKLALTCTMPRGLVELADCLSKSQPPAMVVGS